MVLKYSGLRPDNDFTPVNLTTGRTDAVRSRMDVVVLDNGYLRRLGIPNVYVS